MSFEDNGNSLILYQEIEQKIFAIRGAQVMIDRDLAQLYGVEPKRLGEQVKRNIERFPDSFRFQLTETEKTELVANCDRLQSLKHSSVLPYKKRQLTHEVRTDDRFEQVFSALEARHNQPTQGIFFDGQMFDAYVFINDLLRSAKNSIVLVDNYIDDTVLLQLSKRLEGVAATILTKNITPRLEQDLNKHNSQYPPIVIKSFPFSHDRFLILDGETIYHLGASLKDLGKKWFAFSRMDKDSLAMMERIREVLA